MEKETSKLKSKDNIKTHPLRSSTLMKPTASHLAKQNQAREVNASVRMAQRYVASMSMHASMNVTNLDFKTIMIILCSSMCLSYILKANTALMLSFL